MFLVLLIYINAIDVLIIMLYDIIKIPIIVKLIFDPFKSPGLEGIKEADLRKKNDIIMLWLMVKFRACLLFHIYGPPTRKNEL